LGTEKTDPKMTSPKDNTPVFTDSWSRTWGTAIKNNRDHKSGENYLSQSSFPTIINFKEDK